MALLLIRIEDTASLALNEFFDFNGRCYAFAGTRDRGQGEDFRMEEFYEATMDTEVLENVPVFFVHGEDSRVSVLGWYKKAKICRQPRHLSLFLEGNVEAVASDVVLLPEADRTVTLDWQNHSRPYEVVEEEDTRHSSLQKLLKQEPKKNAFLRYPYVTVKLDPVVAKQPDACVQYCASIAEVLMQDQCQDISELKQMELYAKKALERKKTDPDAFYYHAMACCHLGFFKDGIRSIEKAIALEPEAADLKALKGMLLVEKGYYKDSAAALHDAYERSLEEDYLLLEGRVHGMTGHMDKAYECFKAIKDRTLLENAGIQLKEMEKRWSFADLLTFRRKNRTRTRKTK